MTEVTSVVFNIQRFSVHDGPGIRTAVFFKGCPLECQWCHNPESSDFKAEVSFYPQKCANCGACFAVCPNKCHAIIDGSHEFNRDNCDRCGLCAEKCVFGALSVVGKRVTVREVMAEVMRDEPFYKNSGGGITLSGGEPFAQPEFALALLRSAKKAGLHTCVETSGAVGFEVLWEAAALTDIFLYDVKETNTRKHAEFTGVPNEMILDNLQKLNGLGASIILRCPIIPGLNDRKRHLSKIGELAEALRGVTQVDIEPYHPLGIAKAEALGKQPRYTDLSIPGKARTEEWANAIGKKTRKPVFVV